MWLSESCCKCRRGDENGQLGVVSERTFLYSGDTDLCRITVLISSTIGRTRVSMHRRSLSCLDSLVHSNVGVLVYLSETKLKREGEAQGSLCFCNLSIWPHSVIISYIFLGSYHSFLYAASRVPHFQCSCKALQYIEEALVKPTRTPCKFCPSVTVKAGLTGLLGFQIHIQGSVEVLAE